LLQVTAKLTKKSLKTSRGVISSTIGGLYSMILLINEMPNYILIITKLIALTLIILSAFKFYRVKSFVITLLIFLFVNFLFLGIIVGIYFITESKAITINNSIVYFDISARGLLLSAFFAYILSCLIVRIYNRSVSKGEIYTIEIENMGNKITLFAFADNGNKLKEPFSNYPVIIVDKSKVNSFFDEEKIRLIPVSTVNGKNYLVSFKPDKVTLLSSNCREVIEDVYIALSDDIENENFSAIINPEILSI
jgi:stage II sporulation protein GA (sporulation sigma-E factor processing peptidase)